MKAKGVVVYNNDGVEEIKILKALVEELEAGMDACAQQYSRDQIRIMELSLCAQVFETKVAALEAQYKSREVCRHCAHFDRDPHAYCRLLETHVSPAGSCASFKWLDL